MSSIAIERLEDRQAQASLRIVTIESFTQRTLISANWGAMTPISGGCKSSL
jgi:hypothetical protein